MRVFIDLDSSHLIESLSDRRPVSSLSVKRGDYLSFEVFFAHCGLEETLPLGTTLSFAAKNAGKFDGEVVVYSNDFTPPSAQGVGYVGIVSLNTTALNTALGVDGDETNDVPFVDLMGEFSWVTPNGAIFSSKTINFRVNNDVYRGSEASPDVATTPDDNWVAHGHPQTLTEEQKTQARENIGAGVGAVADNGYLTDGSGYWIGAGANGADGGAAFGFVATGNNGGVSVGYTALSYDYGTAMGYGSIGHTFGLAAGESADGHNKGVAVGSSALGYDGGVALGAHSDGHGMGNVAMGGDDTNTLPAVIPNGWIDTIELGRGTAALQGGLNFRGIGIVDYNGGYPRFLGDGSLLTNLSASNGYQTDGTGLWMDSSASGSDYGVAVGYVAYGNAHGAAIGYGTDGGNYGVAVGYGAHGYNQGVAMGYNAEGSNTGAATGLSAIGHTNGAAMGNNTSGHTYGAAMGNYSQGHNYGAAMGAFADGHGLGNFAGGGDDTNFLPAVIPDGWTDTVELGRGTATLQGGLNFRGIGIVDYNGGNPQFIGDGSRLFGLSASAPLVRSSFTSPFSYIGKAPPDTSESASGWTVSRIEVASSGSTTTLTASGAWTDRASLTYS